MKNRVGHILSLVSLSLTISAGAQTLYTPGGAVGNSGNNNVGIGVAAPSTRLDVDGQVSSGTTLGPKFFTYRSTSFQAGLGQDMNVVGGAELSLFAGNGGVGYINFGMWSPATATFLEKMRLDLSTGALGIGVTSMHQKLEVGRNGGIGFAGEGLNTADKKLYSPVDGILEWVTHNDAVGHGIAVSHQGQRMVYFNTSGPSYINGGNVGIGTDNPQSKLQVNTTGLSWEVQPYTVDLSVNASAGGWARDYRIFNSSGMTNRMHLGATGGPGAVSRAYWVIGDAGADIAGHTLTTGIQLLPNGNVGIGTFNPTQKLSVNGTIRAKEVVVETTGWSDYVFADDYKLQPLAELEQHIKAYKHLPGIPSEKEVAAQGIGLGEMQAKLLAKIE